MTTLLIVDTYPVRILDDGTVRVGQSRVTLDTVVYAYLAGDSPEQIASDYDVLTIAEVYGAIAYYLSQREAVDAYLAEREAHDVLRRQTYEDSDVGLQALRERLRHVKVSS